MGGSHGFQGERKETSRRQQSIKGTIEMKIDCQLPTTSEGSGTEEPERGGGEGEGT